MKMLTGLILALGFFFNVSAFAGIKFVVDHLRCEYPENPIGIDSTKPRLGWIIKSQQRGEIQTAYQILVASTPEGLAKNQGDLWDSGEVKSDQSVLIEYSGKTLQSRVQCYWKVRIWDKDGKVSVWSPPATWKMGLLNQTDWQARWIGKDENQNALLDQAQWIWFPEGNPTESAPVGTRYFRRTIDLPPGRKIVSARRTITADEAFVGDALGHENVFAKRAAGPRS